MVYIIIFTAAHAPIKSNNSHKTSTCLIKFLYILSIPGNSCLNVENYAMKANTQNFAINNNINWLNE